MFTRIQFQTREANRMKILLVDDEVVIREIVTDVLTREGFKVDSTGNGTKALQMFRRRLYDLVITDLCHPGLNGAELIGKILRLKSCPVLLYTGSPIPTLTKPCELRDLVTAAKSLTERKKKKVKRARQQ
jgi:two-component system, OmpR family, response regulator